MKCEKCKTGEMIDVSYMDAYFEGNIYMCEKCSKMLFIEWKK